MASVRLLPRKEFNTVIAHLPGVIAACAAQANVMKGRAEGILAGHHYTGATHITVSHGTVDSFVNLVDPGGAAAAIEFGRSGGRRGATQGIRAISGSF